MSQEPFTHYLATQLRDLESSWTFEPERLAYIRGQIQRQIDRADTILANAGGFHLLAGVPKREADFLRFEGAIDLAERMLGSARREQELRLQEPDTDLGRSRRKNLTEFGEKHGAQRRAEAELEHARWQEEAAKVWDEHPEWKIGAVAQTVVERLMLSKKVDTVSRVIRKP